MRLAIGFAILVTVIGCGDNRLETCPHDRYVVGLPRGCGAAQYFASRDTTELVATQPEVDRYFDRWGLALDAEPALETTGPQRYRNRGEVTIMTRNPIVIAAWTQGIVETGDPEFVAWGDCFVACAGYHTLRAIVPADGEATVYDVGGDPLPDHIRLSPNTRPLPE